MTRSIPSAAAGSPNHAAKTEAENQAIDLTSSAESLAESSVGSSVGSSVERSAEPAEFDPFAGMDLPPPDLWSDEPPLESDLHRRQIELLIRLLEWYWNDRTDFYATGNLTIYYSPNQLKSEQFRGPDFFVVLGTEKRDRRSWTVWHEDGKYPNVIVEILSDSTASTDRNLKKQIYQDTFRTPDYFWFHPNTLEFKGFHLADGEYQEISPTEQGWLWSRQLQLYLGIHEGTLRFFTSDGNLIPLPEEDLRQQAEQERQRAEEERQRAEEERQRAEAAEQELARFRALLQTRKPDNSPDRTPPSEG